MKRNLLKLLGIVMTSVLLMGNPMYLETVHAEPVIVYDFSGYAIPEGQADKLTVDSSTIELMKTQPAYIVGFVDALATKYNNAGAVINKVSEITYLSSVVNGITPGGTHIPTYTTAALNITVPETTAASYVDVNITTQTLTVYSNNQPVITTPIVTGNISRHNDTPIGDFSVKYKQRDRTLIGPNYRSFVHYWMRIVNNVGIHDASWRKNFGGELYKTGGSHECINVPPAIMPSIYSSVPEGTPVYVHY
jgi:lipoprotein-anchoring transpeptidase ErfK/SrfK